MAERLRVGIMCDGPVFQHWQAECIRQVLAVPGVEPVVLIVHDKATTGHRKRSRVTGGKRVAAAGET